MCLCRLGYGRIRDMLGFIANVFSKNGKAIKFNFKRYLELVWDFIVHKDTKEYLLIHLYCYVINKFILGFVRA